MSSDTLKKWLFETHEPNIQKLLDLFVEGIVITDKEGKIVYINQAYCDFLKTSKKSTTGSAIDKIIPTTAFYEVKKTGQAQIKRHHVYADGREVIANRIPLNINGQFEGMIGEVILKSKSELDNIIKKFNLLNEKIKHTERHIDKHIYTSVYSFDEIVAEDRNITEVKTQARRASRTLSPILLEGESGTGKEIFAHSIHNSSPRHRGPFIRVNCASIPSELMESELFGYEEGAFTGAQKSGKPGKFEQASKGIIFLDEIGDMPFEMQSKLLRVLEDNEITRLGGSKPKKLDFKCIAATNKNLEDLVSTDFFK